jgi:hypothetical protein
VPHGAAEAGMNIHSIMNLVQDFGLAATAIGVVMGYFEYLRQGRQRRAEKYFELVREFAKFDEILDLLRTDSPRLKKLRPWQRERFLGFYEDLALLIHSELIQEHLAFYTFGYWLDRVWESKHFWSNAKNKEDGYWFLLRQLHFRMKQREAGFHAFLQRYDGGESYARVRRTFRF